jgi:hypothetical protein
MSSIAERLAKVEADLKALNAEDDTPLIHGHKVRGRQTDTLTPQESNYEVKRYLKHKRRHKSP